MYRLLIVDDEKNIREGLTTFIDYAQYGVEFACSAADGNEALEIISQGSIDIIITDIRMPGMDGITLMKTIAAKYPDIKCIVLSGYDDFSYVREAMQCGAFTYLLKPVKRQELTEAVKGAALQIEREAANKRFRGESLRLMKINVLNRLLMNDISPVELEDKMNLMDIPVHFDGKYRVAIVKLTLDRDIVLHEGDNRLFDAEQLAEHAEKDLGGMLCFDTLGNIVVILNETSTQSITERLESLKKTLESGLSGDVGVVVGYPVTGLLAVNESYRSALSMLNFIYVLGTDHVIDYEEYGVFVRQAEQQSYFNEIEIRRLAQMKNPEALQAKLDEYFAKLRRAPTANLSQIRVCLIEFVATVSEELSLASDTSDNLYSKRHSLIRALTQSTFLKDFERIMHNGIHELVQKENMLPDENTNRFTNEVISIIERNYSDVTLSIKTIAAQMHVNAAYLGRTFYKDTGKYFADYLNEFRIRKAQELLLRPHTRIQEIGQQVGYISSSYFAQVFRQQTGVTPSQWRK